MDKAARDQHARQLNPNNEACYKDRGLTKPEKASEGKSGAGGKGGGAGGGGGGKGGKK